MSLDAMLATFKLAAWLATQGVKVSTGEIALLLAIAESAGEDGQFSAYTRRQDFLCWKLGWADTSTLRRHLMKLKRKGLIEVRSGKLGNESDYRLTFIDKVPSGSLASLFWRQHREAQPLAPVAQGRTATAVQELTTTAVQPCTAKYSTSSTSSPFKRSRARGLRKWFNEELWPRFPDQVDRLNTWHEIEALNPGEALRAEIVAGLDRAIARQEREAAESLDGFVRALPTPRNWLRGRRWEDGA